MPGAQGQSPEVFTPLGDGAGSGPSRELVYLVPGFEAGGAHPGSTPRPLQSLGPVTAAPEYLFGYKGGRLHLEGVSRSQVSLGVGRAQLCCPQQLGGAQRLPRRKLESA